MGKKHDDESKKGRRHSREDEGISKRTQITIGVVMLSLVCGGLFQLVFKIYDALYGGFRSFPLDNPEGLKELMYGGPPWLVHCSYKNSPYKQINPVLDKAARELIGEGIKAATVECDGKLPSGKIFLERFKLPAHTSAFVVANGDKPKPLSGADMADTKAVASFVKSKIKPRISNIQQPGDFPKACLSKKRCLVLAHKSKKLPTDLSSDLVPIMEKYRGVRVVSVDTTRFKVKLDEVLLERRKERGAEEEDDASSTGKKKKAKKEKVDLLCVVKADNDEGADVYFGDVFAGESSDPWAVSSFFSSCGGASVDDPSLKETNGLPRLSAPPQLLNRGTKGGGKGGQQGGGSQQQQPKKEETEEERRESAERDRVEAGKRERERKKKEAEAARAAAPPPERDEEMEELLGFLSESMDDFDDSEHDDD
uniref:Thioredoxin domain-containing protein n=1 Tax=Chromera velia CCMP2878 TaxID=1169474 RepID=A0A0G4IEN4_9ALVE|mmetsp:Transcript_36641/g.72052  ORF Transcript_36641/g.72052 Transcript_36641/m.72052 type:complete len:424 (+) Transcript_36641:166-1437(+)|eukprot:Cvel_13744.t1-p1 / transcript=Cvel_13744.t1 / gene=Cvel_13744 / organism=Chromera_velia_CCMP2878 / gene_product=hypothetical protein / transcript_product=hypothetical protein / location=Cvel_scaffold951:35147-39727(-) / protein_length=423 / sequence_SO=supercontig / SO=protein_coding / is_pseudo=false